MSLEAFIDIRFCDPVISISLNSEGLVYGTMMGRLLYYHFASHEGRVINELSEEFISGVWLTKENTIFACIGDLRALIVSNPESTGYSKQYITFEKIHTSISCELSQVKMHENTILIAFLEPASTSDSLAHTVSPTYVIDLLDGSQKTIEVLKFPPHSILFDFDGKNLLWLEFERNLRKLQMYTVGKANIEVRNFESNRKIGFCKMIAGKIVYVSGQKVIKILQNNGKDTEIGRHSCYIIALNCVKISKVDRNRRIHRIVPGLNNGRIENAAVSEEKKEEFKNFIISADMGGLIKIWDSERLVEEISIQDLPQLTEKYQKMQYFSMGYPYMIAAFGARLAISTDLGVLLIRSRALELQSQLIC